MGYGERDVGWLVFLTKVRKTGMPIRRLREYAQLVGAGRGNEDQRLALLEQHRDAVLAQMAETQRNLEAIDRKIDSYRMRIASVENNLARQPAALSWPRLGGCGSRCLVGVTAEGIRGCSRPRPLSGSSTLRTAESVRRPADVHTRRSGG